MARCEIINFTETEIERKSEFPYTAPVLAGALKYLIVNKAPTKDIPQKIQKNEDLLILEASDDERIDVFDFIEKK